jgi:hypothetical protein
MIGGHPPITTRTPPSPKSTDLLNKVRITYEGFISIKYEFETKGRKARKAFLIMLDASTFSALDDADKALKEAAVQKGFVVHRLRSKKSKLGEIRKVWYACVHGRKQDQSRSYIVLEKKKRETTTRRIECPFKAAAKRHEGKWTIDFPESHHNHEMTTNPAPKI